MKDNHLIEILKEYSSLYRGLVTEKNFSNHEKDTKELLKLNKDNDWDFICSAMDSIDCTCLAIDEFYKFGLYGPTKYHNKGEQYLRLFGILNSIYIQKDGVLNLYNYSRVTDYKQAVDKINNIEIILIRNKLASHNNNYITDKSSKNNMDRDSYYISELHEYSCQYISFKEFKNTGVIDVNLHNKIDEYLNNVIYLMDKICEKSIKTIYKNNKKNIEEYNKKLGIIKKAKENGVNIERQLSLEHLSQLFGEIKQD